jgi:hypothetical protein
MKTRGAATVCGVALALGLAGPAWADEAVLPDGRRLPGRLRLEDGRLVFAPADGRPTLPIAQTERILFTEAPRPLLRAARAIHVHFADGQRLTGALRELTADEVVVQTAWAPRLALPRDRVQALLQPAGWLTIFADDFEDGLQAWKVTDGVRLSDRQQVSGKQALLLGAPGQAAALAVKQPLAAGRLTFRFRDEIKPGTAQGVVECSFQGGAGPWLLRVVIAGERHYRVTSPTPPGAGAPVASGPGWHRLEIEWGRQRALVSVDDVVLADGRFRVPEGALHQVRLAVNGPQGTTTAPVWFDDINLSQAVNALRHASADPEQDEVWLSSGDQILGTVARADARHIDLQAAFGKRVLPWAGVRGIYLKRQERTRPGADGEHVRLWLRAPEGADADQLWGTLKGLDEQALTLEHGQLGQIRLPRAQVRQLRWSGKGSGDAIP